MIDIITGFSNKSFSNYDNAQLPFAERNLIFGYNGKGKSALAEGLKEVYGRQNIASSEQLNNSVRLYNRDYIETSIMLKDDDGNFVDNKTLTGVKADFGIVNVDIQKKIDSKNQELASTKKLMEEDQIKKTMLVDSVNALIEQIYKEKRGKRQVHTKKGEVSEKILAFKNDLEFAQSKFPSEDLSDVRGDDRYEKEVERLENISLGDISEISDDSFKEISEIVAKKYSDDEVPSSLIVDWVNSGIELHKSGDDCHFCGGTISDLEVIRSNIDMWNKNEKQKDAILINEFLEELRVRHSLLTKLEDGQYSEFIDESDKAALATNLKLVKEQGEFLKQKADNISISSDPALNIEALHKALEDTIAFYRSVNNRIAESIADNSNKNAKLGGHCRQKLAVF
ncbi:hypothetical protein FACS1894125_6640 [Actinomycetota bacterium]|nr:hypothetical protein FACS1894125_6640 [Actinomycetota bacterium]